MNKMKLTSVLAVFLIGASHTWAVVPAATVTQTYNKVAHALSATAKGEAARPGTELRNGEYLQTGKAGFAEMVLANKTVARFGPNTVFAYSATSNEANLQAGTMLFSKPKDGKAWTINISGVKATVTGTTGFVEREGNGLIFGVIEGTVHVAVGAATGVLQAGNMLSLAPGTAPQIVAFDVPNFVGSSAFFRGFQGQLPNERNVEKEIAQYNNLAARGFIVPTTPVALASTNGTTGPGAGPTVVDRSARHNGVASSFSPNATSTFNVRGPSVAFSGVGAATPASFAVTGGNVGSSVSAALAGGGFSGGSLSLSGGSASYSGTTAISSGTLALSGASLTTGGAISSTVSGATFVVGNGGTLLVGNGGNGGSLNRVGTGALTVSGANTFTGGTLIAAGSGTPSNNSAIFVGSALYLGNRSFALNGPSLGVYSGGTITQVGAINLANSNNFSGNLTISNGINLASLSSITLTPGSTITNNTNSPLTVGNITVPANGKVTVPPASTH